MWKACQFSMLVRMVPLLMPARCLRLEVSTRIVPACGSPSAVNPDQVRLSPRQVSGGVSYQPLQCPACKLHGDHAPRLFIPSRGDGLGERALSLIWYMAMAASHGFNFGGVVVYKEHCPESHGVDTFAAMSSLLGQDVNTLFLEAPPPLNFSFHDQQSLLKNLKRLSTYSEANVGLSHPEIDSPAFNNDPVTYWNRAPPVTRGFISALRQGAQFLNRTVQYRPGDLTVALHVRRDDITRVSNKFIPDQWYYTLVEKMKETYKVKMDVHVFSSTGTRYAEADFDGFRSRGMTIHLDKDVLDDWAHMARADILVMGRSGYSFIPAMFSQRCVLDPRQLTAGSPSWNKLINFVPVRKTLQYLQSPSLKHALAKCRKATKLQNGTSG